MMSSVYKRMSVGAGKPAKQVTRWMAPALPVFAAKAAPTGIAPAFEFCIGQSFIQEIAPAVGVVQGTTLVVVSL